MKYNDMTYGQSEAVFNRLGGEDGVRRFLAGELEVVEKRPPTNPRLTIDCDVRPKAGGRWEIVEHRHMGLFQWDPSRVGLYYTLHQKSERWTSGQQVFEGLKDQQVLNACVMDFLIANPEHIPPEWSELCIGKPGQFSRSITFWGTQFRSGALGPQPFSLSYSTDQRGGWYAGFEPCGLQADWTRSPAAILLP